MARHSVSVEKLQDRLSFHVSGPNVAKADTKLLTACVSELLECAEKNDCFTKGLSVECIATIARHDKQAGCVSKAFGFVRAG